MWHNQGFRISIWHDSPQLVNWQISCTNETHVRDVLFLYSKPGLQKSLFIYTFYIRRFPNCITRKQHAACLLSYFGRVDSQYFLKWIFTFVVLHWRYRKDKQICLWLWNPLPTRCSFGKFQFFEVKSSLVSLWF